MACRSRIQLNALRMFVHIFNTSYWWRSQEQAAEWEQERQKLEIDLLKLKEENNELLQRDKKFNITERRLTAQVIDNSSYFKWISTWIGESDIYLLTRQLWKMVKWLISNAWASYCTIWLLEFCRRTNGSFWIKIISFKLKTASWALIWLLADSVFTYKIRCYYILLTSRVQRPI